MLRSTVQTVDPLPSPQKLTAARSRIISSLPVQGVGVDAITQHLKHEIASGLSNSSLASTYYGFVTGGATEAAKLADHLAIQYDQNVQVHLPNETIATDVEDAALKMLCQLLHLQPGQWPHRTSTTGATASNVIGLALARQTVLEQLAKSSSADVSVAEHGLFHIMNVAGISNVQILTTVPHSSLKKAASIIGLGRASVVDVSQHDASHRFDFNILEQYLAKQNTASIIAVSCAEVNTGLFATTGQDMQRLRKLADMHNAWIHVDGAFGLLARALPKRDEYSALLDGVDGLELADSITGDAHKLINVPYDCGFFLSRSLNIATEVFQNANAAYLSSAASAGIPSPLNIGIENSRRFRALPVYATLAAYGVDGYSNMIQRQVTMARAIAGLILDSSDYELLPKAQSQSFHEVYIVVLFRAVDEELNKVLVQYINATRKVYVSGTQYDGKPAARVAVSNWQADVNSDLLAFKEVLEAVLCHQFQRKLT